MSTLTKKTLRHPMNSASIDKAIGIICRAFHEQLTAADLTGALMTNGIVKQEGTITDLFYVLCEAFETNEAMTIDVLKNGVSILEGGTAVTLTAASTAGEQVALPLDAALAHVSVGDILTVTRNWTTGAGVDTTPATAVVAEISRPTL